MSLYIGAYYPDRQLDESLFANSLLKIAANIAKQRHHAIQKSPPYLDIKFLISGKQEAPDFEGMRLYAYDQKSSTLRIESAVPERMMNSTHSEDYIVAVLQDAVDIMLRTPLPLKMSHLCARLINSLLTRFQKLLYKKTSCV